MPIESVTYISDLNASNPVGAQDTVATLDDHIRNLKVGLLNSIPLSGAVTSSHTELNYLDGVTGTTGSGNLVLSASPTLTGTVGAAAITASGTVTGNLFSGSGASLTSLPAGQLTGNIADARVQETNVTQHEAALSISESQISFSSTFLEAGDTAATLTITTLTSPTIEVGNTDTTITRDGAGQVAIEGRPVFVNDNAALTSSKIFFSTSDPSGGSDGDIWLKHEA